jgi:dihydroflavonol-4-reductase
MRVLVTGATGFLGAHVLHTLLREGHEVRALVRPGQRRNHIRMVGAELFEGDLLDTSSVRAACDDVQGLVNCAARVGYRSQQNALMDKVNVDAVTTLLRAAHEAGLERVVHVSTAGAVGVSRSGEILDESSMWSLESRLVHYTLTKRRGEERALAAAWGGMPVVVVNPSTIFGPRLDGLPPSPILMGIERGRLPWIPPGGVSVTDVSDVAQGIVSALTRGRPGERYLLSGHNLTWQQLYQAIVDVTGGRLPKKHLTVKRLARKLAKARILNAVRLARFPETPEVLRSYGTYGWYDSTKAARELGFETRPLPDLLRHALGQRI